MHKVRPKYNPVRRAARLCRLIWNHPSNRRRRFSAFTGAVSWQLRKRLIRKPLEVNVFDGVKFICHPLSTFASNVIYFGSYSEYDELHFVNRYLRPGDGFFDIGANVGIYSLLAAKIVGPSGTVHAFEPFPDNADRLEQNLRRNCFNQAFVHRLAVTDHAGEVEFLADGDVSNRIVASRQEGHATIKVRCATLDDALPTRPYSMGKLDVEGAEPLALKGASSLLESGNPPVWQLEIDPGTLIRHGFQPQDCFRQFLEREFVVGVYRADSNRITYPSTVPSTATNILAIAKHARDLVEERLEMSSVSRPRSA